LHKISGADTKIPAPFYFLYLKEQKDLPPKKNLSSLREITRRVKIVIGAAPPHFQNFAGGFLVAAGGEMRPNYFKNRPPKFIYSRICLARGFAPRFGKRAKIPSPPNPLPFCPSAELPASRARRL